METYVILRRGAWKSPEELEEAAARSKQVGDEEMSDDIRWIRSYVLEEGGGSVGTVCIYQATSEDKVREHASRAGLVGGGRLDHAYLARAHELVRRPLVVGHEHDADEGPLTSRLAPWPGYVRRRRVVGWLRRASVDPKLLEERRPLRVGLVVSHAL
jgi:hypothetical protein